MYTGVFIYMSSKELGLGLSSGRPGKVITNLPPKPAGKTVPCDWFEAVPLIPMQLVMAAAQMRACEHLQMLKLPVIMQLQDRPLPQPPNTIHIVACAPFQVIFGDALLLCSSSMHPLWHLITFKSMHRAHQQLKLRHARDLSPQFCTSCSLTFFGPAKFMVDSLDFSQVVYPFVKSFDTFVPCTRS